MWQLVEHGDWGGWCNKKKKIGGTMIRPNNCKNELVVVPISSGRDRACISALLWAFDNILTKGQTLVLLHVTESVLGSSDASLDVFTMYRSYCEWKNIEFIQVLVEEYDVANGIVEFIAHDGGVRELIIGVSPRSIVKRILRRVKRISSVVERVIDDAPVSCNINVISDKQKFIMGRYSDFKIQLEQQSLPPSSNNTRTRSNIKRIRDACDQKSSTYCCMVKYVPQLPAFETIELGRLAHDLMSRYTMSPSPEVKWENIKGVGNAKQLLREEIVKPLENSNNWYFSGLLAPCKTILLFGPPGTGKTMLGNAVATESQATFFNIASSSLLSNKLTSTGDRAEMVMSVLFEIAKHRAPSIIFLDEIDWIIGNNNYNFSDRGGYFDEDVTIIRRRLKRELLKQMDGLKRMKDERVFVLATTNQPWKLVEDDDTMVQCFEKRILVSSSLPVPEDDQDRKAMFEEDILLPSSSSSSSNPPPYNLLVGKKELPIERPVGHEEDIEKIALTKPSSSTHHLHPCPYQNFNAKYGSR